jgi:uracil-DNA glycosylase
MSHPLLTSPEQELELLSQTVSACSACPLHATRSQTVFADGNPKAKLLVLGEAPGQQEDESGLPFVGRSGALLTRLLAEVGLRRPQDVYICNVVKCRPPENRKPAASETKACFGHLKAQLALLQPQVIVTAGATALFALLYAGEKPPSKVQPISKLRGQWLQVSWLPNTHIMPVFHPAYLLRNASLVEGSPKALTLQDLKAVKDRLEKALSS